jgi:pyruvate dehydrogenase E2 component (dihydrolipoamide acetyltransferase)
VTAPHVTQFDEADITDLEDFRKSMLADAEKRGVKLTLLAFLMKAVVNALRTYPNFNASLSPEGDSLILKQYYHVGFACDTPDGLVVPVVRNVNQKDVMDIARDLAELSAKARERKLKVEEMQGGCFTISSLGGIGGTMFTPIINCPEVAILGVSRASMQPVYNAEIKGLSHAWSCHYPSLTITA